MRWCCQLWKSYACPGLPWWAFLQRQSSQHPPYLLLRVLAGLQHFRWCLAWLWTWSCCARSRGLILSLINDHKYIVVHIVIDNGIIWGCERGVRPLREIEIWSRGQAESRLWQRPVRWVSSFLSVHIVFWCLIVFVNVWCVSIIIWCVC